MEYEELTEDALAEIEHDASRGDYPDLEVVVQLVAEVRKLRQEREDRRQEELAQDY